MRLDCVLINPSLHEGGKFPPIGLIALAAYARAHELTVEICDANVLNYKDEEVVDIILDLKPRAVGFSFMTPQVPYVKSLSFKIKRKFPQVIQIAGGIHVNAIPYESIKDFRFIDYFVLGEGERTFVEILTSLRLLRQLDPLTIDGLLFRDELGNVIKTGERVPFKDLDSLPMPAWDKLPVKKYVVTRVSDREMVNEKGTALSISASRGCPWNCLFCASHSVFARGYRARSFEKVVDELEYLYSKYNIDHFFFVDEYLFFKKENIVSLANEIIGRNLPITWSCTSRVDSPAICDEILELAKRAGCRRIDYGVESGSASMLKEIRKQINLGQIFRAHHVTYRHGISTVTLMMVGHPNESMQDFRDSLRLLFYLESENAMFGTATPFPGTELYEIAKENNWLRSDDWAQYYINNTYPVMRNHHFTHDEIYYFSIFANMLAYIIGLMSKKKHYAQDEMKSFWKRFKFFYDVISNRHGFAIDFYLPVRKLSKILEMYIVKDSNYEEFEELFQSISARDMIDNRLGYDSYEKYLSEASYLFGEAVIFAPTCPRQLSMVVDTVINCNKFKSIVIYVRPTQVHDVELSLENLINRVEIRCLEPGQLVRNCRLFLERKKRRLFLMLFDQDRIRKGHLSMSSEFIRVFLMTISFIPSFIVFYNGKSCSSLEFIKYLIFNRLGATLSRKYKILRGISLGALLHAFKLSHLSGRLNSFQLPVTIPESTVKAAKHTSSILQRKL